MDSTNSKELDERYNIRYIPSFVFVDEEGNEVDRIVGFLPPDEYLAEMTRIRKGIDTYPDLLDQWDKHPQDPDVLEKLAVKVEAMSGRLVSIDYWQILFGLDDASELQHATANLKLAVYHAREADDPQPLLTLLTTEKDIDILMEAHAALRSYYREVADTTAEAVSYRRYTEFMSGAGKASPGFLNGYAWRMTELGTNLEDALVRIDQAIALLDTGYMAMDRAQILDTRAEILWRLDRTDEAIEVIRECIDLVPDDPYYGEQKAKFEGSGT